eukprot:1914426-Rhodomonas_salina.1
MARDLPKRYYISTNVSFDEGRLPYLDNTLSQSEFLRIWGDNPRTLTPIVHDLTQLLHIPDQPDGYDGPLQVFIDGAVVPVERELDGPAVTPTDSGVALPDINEYRQLELQEAYPPPTPG